MYNCATWAVCNCVGVVLPCGALRAMRGTTITLNYWNCKFPRGNITTKSTCVLCKQEIVYPPHPVTLNWTWALQLQPKQCITMQFLYNTLELYMCIYYTECAILAKTIILFMGVYKCSTLSVYFFVLYTLLILYIPA